MVSNINSTFAGSWDTADQPLLTANGEEEALVMGGMSIVVLIAVCLQRFQVLERLGLPGLQISGPRRWRERRWRGQRHPPDVELVESAADPARISDEKKTTGSENANLANVKFSIEVS